MGGNNKIDTISILFAEMINQFFTLVLYLGYEESRGSESHQAH